MQEDILGLDDRDRSMREIGTAETGLTPHWYPEAHELGVTGAGPHQLPLVAVMLRAPEDLENQEAPYFSIRCSSSHWATCSSVGDSGPGTAARPAISRQLGR